MRLVLCSAVLLALAGPAHAASWVIDPGASKLGFSGSQAGAAFQGSFKTFSGTIEFDPAHPEAGSADISIDIASAATGDTQRDTALPQPEWFDAASFPKANFHVASFVAKGGDVYEAAGTLTVRGIGVATTLPFTLSIAGDTATAKGHVQLVRTAFGVGQGPWATGDMVALEVGVDVEVVAKRK